MQGTDILNYFTPIIWEAGHMGSFLENFLGSKPKLITKYNRGFGIMPNLEWGYVDPFLNFFGSDFWKFDGYRQILSTKYTGLELQEQIAMAVFYKNLKYSLLDKDHYTIPGDEDLLNPESYQWNISLEELTEQANPYMKYHAQQYINAPSKRNRAVFCTFPKNKSWLPYLLLLYKFNRSKRSLQHLPGLQHLKNIKTLQKDFVFHDYYFTAPIKGAYVFNIYKLIFEKDLTQVYELYPNFQFDKFKQYQLELAKNTSIHILNKYNMDYTFRCYDNFTVNDMISMAKL